MSFLRDFMESCTGTECPKDYILWSAYAGLSLAVGRRAYLNCEHFHIIPNIYVVLVGPAGNRKTSARDKMMDLFQVAIPDIVVSAECETKQGITRFLGAPEQARYYTSLKGEKVDYRPYGLFASELMNYLALDPAGMVTFLTDVYDRKFYKYRLKNEEHTLVNPYIVMLACTVPEWLTNQIKSDEFCSGFGRRTILVCNDSDIRVRPFKSEDAKAAEQRCIKFLQQLKEMKETEFVLSPEASQWFWGTVDAKTGVGDGWYFKHKLPEDKFLRSWRRSIHVQLFKLAILTSISEGAAPVIHLNHMQMCLSLLEEVEKYLPMLTSRMGRSEMMEPAQAVLKLLKAAGGFELEKVVKMKTFPLFKNGLEQWQLLEWLKNTDQVKAIPKDGKTYLALAECVKTETKK